MFRAGNVNFKQLVNTSNKKKVRVLRENQSHNASHVRSNLSGAPSEVSSSASFTEAVTRFFQMFNPQRRVFDELVDEQLVHAGEVSWCLENLKAQVPQFINDDKTQLLVTIDHQGLYIPGFNVPNTKKTKKTNPSKLPAVNVMVPIAEGETGEGGRETSIPDGDERENDRHRVRIISPPSQGRVAPACDNCGLSPREDSAEMMADVLSDAVRSVTIRITDGFSDSNPKNSSFVNLPNPASFARSEDETSNQPSEPQLAGLPVWMGRATTSQLTPIGWKRVDQMQAGEALVYIHGYNTQHTDALKMLGQMLTLGNFPNYIKVFLFAWPGGVGPLSFFTAQKAAEDPRLWVKVADFMRALQANGLHDIHIMAHSMGSRVWVRGFNYIVRNTDLLSSRGGQLVKQTSAFDAPPLRLVSVTFLHPEYHLRDFVDHDYSLMKAYCRQITILGDTSDKALWWSELISRTPAMGREVFGYFQDVDRVPSESFFERNALAQMSPFADSAVVNRPLSASNRMNTNTYFAGFTETNPLDDPKEWLDVDVIDATFCQSNAHLLRHSFFSLNREIIDDIRESLTSRKRAQHRTSRLER
eukprot:GHVN01001352.1.p1 GENE.GHVN01001352.1~~GHVN01001352.1.p1  ORF type:complete len:586 (+),score=52.49 GHVN01001352.1:2400-4157(+)